MIKTFSFMFILLFLISCGKDSNNANSNNLDEITDSELMSSAAPVQAQTFNINADLFGFSRMQEDKIYQAFELIKKVIATDEFKRKVLGKTYKGIKQYVDNSGLSNAQIYKKIIEGAEKLSPRKNNAMDLNLESYYVNANVIGYTLPNINKVYINTKYLNLESFTPQHVAMNVMHEWLHKLGFKHDQKNSPSRPHSVPYAIGYIMRTIAFKI